MLSDTSSAHSWRRRGPMLSIAGLRTRGRISGETGHESCQIRQAARLHAQSALREVKHAFATNFADGVADGPGTLHLLGRPLAVLWSPGGHCAIAMCCY